MCHLGHRRSEVQQHSKIYLECETPHALTEDKDFSIRNPMEGLINKRYICILLIQYI